MRIEGERGKFIGFEGIGRSGKSTVITPASEYVRSKGFEVVSTREPGGVPEAEEIRNLIFRLKGKEILTPDQQIAMFFTARHFWLERFVRTQLESGTIVLTDRSYPATAAYQGYGEGGDLRLIEAWSNEIVGDLVPNGVILLDVSADTFFQRKRDDGGDPFDSKPREYHERVIDGYREMARNKWGGLDWYVVDGEQSREGVLHDVVYCVDQILTK